MMGRGRMDPKARKSEPPEPASDPIKKCAGAWIFPKNSGGNSAIFEFMGPHVSARQKILGAMWVVIESRVSANQKIMGLSRVSAS